MMFYFLNDVRNDVTRSPTMSLKEQGLERSYRFPLRFLKLFFLSKMFLLKLQFVKKFVQNHPLIEN